MPEVHTKSEAASVPMSQWAELELEPSRWRMRSSSPWCLPLPLPGDHKPTACRQARQPGCFCTSPARTQAGDETAERAMLLQAAATHMLPPVQFASDLLERVFAEENEQLPWLLFILPGHLLRAAALLITRESPSSVFSNKLVRVNLFMLCCLQ